MGYTHYWTFKDDVTFDNKQIEEIVEFFNERHDIEGTKLGYLEYDRDNEYDDVPILNFNGSGDESHENFIINKVHNKESFNFCKTARKEYDLLVMAMLIKLKDMLEDKIEITSDGNYDEWGAILNELGLISYEELMSKVVYVKENKYDEQTIGEAMEEFELVLNKLKESLK